MKYTSIAIQTLLIIYLLLTLGACSTAASVYIPPTISIIPENILLTSSPFTIPDITRTPLSTFTATPTSERNDSLPTHTQIVQYQNNWATPSVESYTDTIPVLAETTSDLLFISAGNLQRWDYVTGYSGLLAENVTDYYTSADGKKIVLLRPHRMTANGMAIYDLDLLDFNAKQIYPIKTKISQWENISLSPDGSWLAYCSKEQGKNISIINIEQPDQIIELGDAQVPEHTICSLASWSANSKELVWSDTRGVWHITIAEQVIRQLQSEIIQLTDPKGNELQVTVHYEDLIWSPLGRYILTRVIPNDSEIRWYAIIDTANGRCARIPDTYHASNDISSVLWSEDGSLFVAHAGGTTQHPQPSIQRWFLLATHDNLLVSHTEFLINEDLTESLLQHSNAENTLKIEWIAQSGQLFYFLVFSSQESFTSASILTFYLEEGIFSKILDMERTWEEMLWAPDNSGFLVFDSYGQIQYLKLDSGTQLNMRSVFGSDVSNFLWLPPAPRQ